MWYIPFAIGKLHQASAHVMILSWPKDGRKHLKNCRPLHLCSYSSFVSLSRWILSLVLSSGLLCPLFQLQSSWWHDCRSVHLIERSFPFCSCVHFRLTISVTFLRSSSLTKTPACFSNVNTHSCDVVSCTYIRLILELWQRSHNFRAFGCCFCCNRTSEHATGKCDVADSAQLQAMDGGRSVVQSSAEFKRPDENLVRMLRMVIDGRCLVVEELDEIIGYFQQQRNVMAKAQGIAPASKSLAAPPGLYPLASLAWW